MLQTFNFIRKFSKFRGGHGLFGSYAGYVQVIGRSTNGYITYICILFAINLLYIKQLFLWM